MAESHPLREEPGRTHWDTVRIVELRDNQPMKHEFGNRIYVVADVEPLDVDGVRTVQVGTAAFFLASIALLPFYGALEDSGRTWWLWMSWPGWDSACSASSTAAAGGSSAPRCWARTTPTPDLQNVDLVEADRVEHVLRHRRGLLTLGQPHL